MVNVSQRGKIILRNFRYNGQASIDCKRAYFLDKYSAEPLIEKFSINNLIYSFSAKYLSASRAALQPSPAAVIACPYT